MAEEHCLRAGDLRSGYPDGATYRAIPRTQGVRDGEGARPASRILSGRDAAAAAFFSKDAYSEIIMRDLNELTVLVLPGLGGAGPDHWQTAWQGTFPAMQRVEQANWERPVYEEWSTRLTEAVTRAPRPVVLIAHSLGTSLTMRWSNENRDGHA